MRHTRYSPAFYDAPASGRQCLSRSPSYDDRYYSTSPHYGQRTSLSRSYGRRARSPSYSPYQGGYGDGYRYGSRSRSPRRRSLSPRRGRSYSRSPPPRRDRRISPYANGSPIGRDRRRSRS